MNKDHFSPLSASNIETLLSNLIFIMKKSVFGLLICFGLFSCATLQDVAGGLLKPSNLETVTALKDILNSSAFKAISALSKLNNGGAEALLPKEIQPVFATLKTLGLGGEIDKATKAIGDASEIVAAESAGIVKDAVSELNFGDAAAIVLGGESAATGVLKQAMYGSVKKRYSERLNQELGKSDVLKYWPMATSAYNLFSNEKVEGELSDFLAERAVDGMFLAMGKEEAAIRADYKSLGNQVVNKVFDYYTKNKG